MLATAEQVVVIASAPVVSALRTQLDRQPNARIFSEADFLLALDTIIADVPKVIALDPEFAATARGAALVARVKADPRLSGAEIRALVRNDVNEPVLSEPIQAGCEKIPALLPLDRCGTRSAIRFPMREEVEARLNGYPARLVNLSVTGAQLLASIRLRPTEWIRLVLLDEAAQLRLSGVVAWATLEMSTRAAAQRYRFGVEFREGDPEILERYCLRYRSESPAKV